MTVHDFGFALTFAILLFGPQLPLGELGAPSLAFLGFGVWFLLSSRLPLLRFTRMKSLMALLGFAIYAVLVSMTSTSVSSIVYALQFALYVFAAALLIPAYLADEERRERGLRILAWFGAIYAVGLIVSLWTGPFYDITGSHAKHYQGATLPRGVGFASGPNLAGGIAAMIALLTLLLCRPGGKLPVALGTLAIAGMIATMSRAAFVGFAAAMMIVAGLAGLRFLWGSGIRIWPCGVGMAATLAAGLIVLPSTHSGIEMAMERLALNSSARANDINARVESWMGGLREWHASDLLDQMIGAGMKSTGRSSNGVYALSHSMYVTILQDFGVVGLLLFGSILSAAMATYASRLIRAPDRFSAFALGALVLISVENVLHPFSYATSIVVFLILALTYGEMHKRVP